MDHIDQAVYSVIHDSNISAKNLAANLGIPHQTLLNKANCNSMAFLTPHQIAAVTKATGNVRIIDALSIESKMGDNKLSGSLIDCALATAKEHGDVIRVIQQARESARFTPAQQEECQTEISEAIEALKHLQQVVVGCGEQPPVSAPLSIKPIRSK